MKTFTFTAGILLKRSLFLCSLLLILFATSASAQQKTVTGSVKNAEDDSPLPAVTIQIKGTRVGTTTDQNGNFSIRAADNQTIVATAVGFAPLENRVGNRSVINFNLTLTTGELEGIVVTALGIKRAEKALGYSAQQLSGDDLNEARSNNWSGALSGKVAGLQLLSAGSGPLSSTRVTLRGDISLNPNNNNALIVVDGVPMNNRNMTSSGVDNAYQAGSGNDVPVDFGNNINDINPDDIESITVLKGPGATALYGSRAGNGALLITTKSGSKKQSGIGVTINSNISFNTILHWPDYQYEYGQGTGKALNAAGEKYYSYGATVDGASTSGTSSAYGPAFNGQMYYQYDPVLQGRG
ncbi:MAG: carboxypeptidase-like regulatory domain-containing protein, partial [Chitinophagaceae bacterium]